MKKGHVYIGLTALLFSTAEIATKFISQEIHPLQLTFLRFLVGGLFLLPFALLELKRKGLRLSPKDLGTFALLGFIGVTVSMSLFQFAVLYAKAGTVAVVFSTNTIFTALFAVWILQERFTASAAGAIALGLAGVVCIFNPFRLSPDALGIALALASSLLFALFGVLGSGRARAYGGAVTNSLCFLSGALFLLPVMAVTGTPVLQGITLGNLPVVLYVSLAVTGLGYMCYFTAMRITSAIETSTVFFIKPALAPLLSLLILSEPIGWSTVLGIGLIAAGAFLQFRRKAKATQKHDSPPITE